VVDTYDSDFSAKVVMMTWHTNIVRRSAGLGTLLSSEDHEVAAAFYRETVTCLQTATRHTEIVDILEDFAREVLTDLELKDITFRSRELIINCLQLLENLVTLPAIQQRERGRHTEILPVHANQTRLDAENKKLAQSALSNTKTFAERKKKNTSSTASLAFSDVSEYETEPMSVEQEQKLKIIAVDRMKLVFCILKVCTQRSIAGLCALQTSTRAYPLTPSILLLYQPLHADVFLAAVQLGEFVQQICAAARPQVLDLCIWNSFAAVACR
jgi:hypothetical protein